MRRVEHVIGWNRWVGSAAETEAGSCSQCDIVRNFPPGGTSKLHGHTDNGVAHARQGPDPAGRKVRHCPKTRAVDRRGRTEMEGSMGTFRGTQNSPSGFLPDGGSICPVLDCPTGGIPALRDHHYHACASHARRWDRTYTYPSQSAL
jgi:hypothetical protein